ncbi:MAG: hypothetical protein M1827_005415 [Pycnora praestabilis]|nr:MAG: hypothetical protein M1827_005415 [Pycnora praestabilis]
MASHDHSDHTSHTHSHGGDDHGHGHDHDHDHADVTEPAQPVLYSQIDFDKITTLNESVPSSGAAIVKKEWANRMEARPELESDADEQLLMYIPFTGQVKLHSLLIRTAPHPSSPQTLHLFLNRDDVDFDLASSLPPSQTLRPSLTSDVQELPVKRSTFNTTRSLTLFFEDNFGQGEEDTTRISYLGFKGEFMRLSREPVSFLYESAARPTDHEVGLRRLREEAGQGIGEGGGGSGF